MTIRDPTAKETAELTRKAKERIASETQDLVAKDLPFVMIKISEAAHKGLNSVVVHECYLEDKYYGEALAARLRWLGYKVQFRDWMGQSVTGFSVVACWE